MKKHGSYYYDEWNGIKIRTSFEYQIFFIKEALDTLKQKGFPFKNNLLKKIQFDNNFVYPNYSGFFDYGKKSIHLNPKKVLRNEKIGNRQRYKEYLESLMSHEIIHAYDFDFKISYDFFDQYKKRVDKAQKVLSEKLFQYGTEGKLKRNGVPAFMKAKSFVPYRKRLDKKARDRIGVPSVYSLVAPWEFVAELFSFYFLDKTKIPNKALRKLVGDYVKKL